MKKGFKRYWYELTAYITKEQAFLLGIYFAFVAYLKNNKIGALLENKETGGVADLKQLREIFRKIPGYDLKVAANDFEEIICWEIFEKQQIYLNIARGLKAQIEYVVQTEDDLEMVIETFEELAGELDNLMFTPPSLNRMISLFPMNPKITSVGELYSGLCGTGIQLWKSLDRRNKEISFSAEEQRKLYCDIALIRMFCHGMKKVEVLKTDITVDGNKSKMYDLIIADLPKRNNESIYVKEQDELFGNLETIFAEWVSIQQILRRLSDTGKAIIIVTKGALVRQREEVIRSRLIQLDWVEAVITLPQNIYVTSNLGFEILVLNKKKQKKNKGKVFFADLSNYGVRKGKFNTISKEGMEKVIRAYQNLEICEHFSTVVSTTVIAENESSWNPFLYLRLQQTRGKWNKTVALGEIAEITRGVQITKEEEKILSENATHYWLNIRNVDEQGLVLEDAGKLKAKTSDWERKFGIQEDDIILTSKVTVLKLCIIGPDPEKAFICSNLTRIRVDREKYSPYILYEFLHSEEGMALLESIQTGTTIKVLSNKNLEKMQIPVYKDILLKGEQLKEIHLSYKKEKKKLEEAYKNTKQEILKSLLEEDEY